MDRKNSFLNSNYILSQYCDIKGTNPQILEKWISGWYEFRDLHPDENMVYKNIDLYCDMVTILTILNISLNKINALEGVNLTDYEKLRDYAYYWIMHYYDYYQNRDDVIDFVAYLYKGLVTDMVKIITNDNDEENDK